MDSGTFESVRIGRSRRIPIDALEQFLNWRRRVWLPATEAAGLAGLHFHDLRSNATTALIAEGVDVKVAQVRIVHSDPRITLGLYARATPEADRRAADRVGERFRPRDGRAMEGSRTRSRHPRKAA
jgi:integrase